MGTNYYRIPTEEEMNIKKQQLIREINEMDMSPKNVERNFQFEVEGSFDYFSPWDKFINGNTVHLGKRSGGWKFCWDLNEKKYYTNKKQLLSFIRSGRVVNEYGELIDNEEFIKMALEWGEPDGYVYNQNYIDDQYKKIGKKPILTGDDYFDIEIDGLRFSAYTNFC